MLTSKENSLDQSGKSGGKLNENGNDKQVRKLIWKTLIPNFTSELSLSATSIVDGAIVGSFYGAKGLAAVGAGVPKAVQRRVLPAAVGKCITEPDHSVSHGGLAGRVLLMLRVPRAPVFVPGRSRSMALFRAAEQLSGNRRFYDDPGTQRSHCRNHPRDRAEADLYDAVTDR